MNKQKPPTQRALAKELGLSQPMVSKLHSRGMPVDDVAAALRWRDRNLDLTQSKANRPASGGTAWRGGRAAGVPPNYGIGHWTGWYGVKDCLDLIHEMGRRAGPNFDAWAEPLRAAMRLLPPAYWDAVNLPDLVWSDLVALGDDPPNNGGILQSCKLAILHVEDAEEFPKARLLARYWLYMCACGLIAAVPRK